MQTSISNPSPSDAAGGLRLPTQASAVKIAFCYAAVGALWILCSGWLLRRFVQDSELEALLETLKGWFYVSVTAFLLWLLLDRYFRLVRTSGLQLQAREAQLRVIGDNLPNGYLYQYTLDAAGQRHFTYVSAGVKQVHGVTPEEVMGNSDWLSSQVDPAQRSDLAAAELESARTLADFQLEIEIQAREGTRRRLRVCSRPRRNTEGLVQWEGVAQDITERHAVLKERLELQSQLAGIVKTVPGLICSFRLRPDGSACMPYASPAIADLYGVQPEDAAADFAPILARIHPEDQPHLQETIATSARTMKPWRDTFRVQHPEKGERWVEGHSVPQLEPDGSVLWHGFVQDVTERHQAQETLEQLGRHYQLILNSVAEGVLGLDLEGKHTFVNPAAARMLGYAAQELIGCSSHSTWHRAHEDASEYLESDCPVLAAARAGLGNRATSDVFWRKDGTSFPVELASTPILARGQLIGVVVTFSDISERKQSEEALRQSEQRFRSLVHFSPVAMGLADKTGRILLLNQSFTSLFGYDATDLATLSDWWRRAYPKEEDRHAMAEHWTRMLEENSASQLDGRPRERVITCKDGTERVAQISSVTLPEGVLVTFVDVTETRRSEAALRASEQQLRAIFELASVGVAQADPRTGKFLRVNKKMCAITGYAEDELLLRRIPDLTYADDRERDGELLRKVVEGEAPDYRIEKRYLRKDGTVVWVNVNMTVIRDGAGQPWRSVCMIEDISGRKKMELALREREQQLRLFVEHSPAAIAMLDRQMRYLVVSERWLADYRLGRRNLVGLSHYDVFPEVPERWKEIHRRCLAGAVEKCEADPFPRADGTLDWVHWEIRPWFEAHDEVGGLIIFSEVISARVRAEQALRDSEFRRALALDAAKAGTWEWDLSSNQNYWSDELWELYGLAPYSCAPSYEAWRQTVHPDDLGPLEESLKRTVATGAEINMEWRAGQQDSGERWLLSRGRPSRDESGRVARYQGVVMDITQRKQAERALQQRNEELVRFVYTVSHDLKSPLVTIQTFLGYLEKDIKTQDGARTELDIGYIRRAATKMQQLLEELLELSRIGRKTNPPEQVSLQTLVQEALDLVAGAISSRRVKIEVTREPILLVGDRRRLLEVFQNLLDNAVKFMGDQPEPRIEIGVEQATSQLIVFIRDNGAGIDPRHQAKLFGLFEKLHPGTPGSGIGLALVKRIVEVHGGRIWAESAGLGQGATFRFTLQELKKA